MSFLWPAPLVQAIARRRAVILIGSGVSANATNEAGERPPTWGAFLSRAYDGLNSKKPHIKKAINQYDYLAACDYLKSEYNSDWQELIRDTFSKPQFKPADIHKAVFELDSRIVISLNFDKIYETYAIKASDNTITIKNYYDDEVRQTVAGVDRYILKPHGTIDTISKMIFTLDDYGSARTKYAPFYELMTALLHTHTFLCIGCGLSDPDMKLIFEDYRYKFSESPHYITLPSPMSSSECLLIQKTRGLNVLTYSPKDSHAELTIGLFKLGEAVNNKRNEIASRQDW